MDCNLKKLINLKLNEVVCEVVAAVDFRGDSKGVCG